MTDTPPSPPEQRPVPPVATPVPAGPPAVGPRWPLILGALLGGFLLVGAGLALGWYLFYRPIVNVAVQLPAPPVVPPAGPDLAAIKALEEQIEKQKGANKQVEDQIAILRDRLRADVCTPRDPTGKLPNTPAGPGVIPPAGERKTENVPNPNIVPASAELPKAGKASSAQLAAALEQATVLVISEKGDSGTGFFVAPGLVVTNHHVVSRLAPGSEALIVSRHLKTGYVGTIVATSPPGQPSQADFAVIKVDLPAGAASTLSLANEPAALSDVVAAGYPALAIAQDKNLRRLAAGDLKSAPTIVLTKGTVSAVQNKERNTPMVLHSADISSGNSGGPLVDACGRVVGINSFLVSDRQTSKANYALGASWLGGFLKNARTSFDWRSDACI
jgi:serine protease Do